MTKDKARIDGFCDHCAAFVWGKQLCEVLAVDKTVCQLDSATRERWMVDYGLKSDES